MKMSFSYIVFVVAFIVRMHHKEPVNYLTHTKNFRFINIIPNWIFTINARKKCRFEIKKRILAEYELCVSTRDERIWMLRVHICMEYKMCGQINTEHKPQPKWLFISRFPFVAVAVLHFKIQRPKPISPSKCQNLFTQKYVIFGVVFSFISFFEMCRNYCDWCVLFEFMTALYSNIMCICFWFKQ